MPEKSPHQLTPESSGKDAWLKELNSKKTRDAVLHFIYSMKMKIFPEEAEDVVQEAMLKAAKTIQTGKFREGADLKTWLYVVVKNTALDLLRRKKVRSQTISISDIPEMPSEEPSSEEKYITLEEIKKLKSHFNKLTPPARKLMELVADGLSLKEISEQSGISQSALKQRYWKITKLLRESIKNEGNESEE